VHGAERALSGTELEQFDSLCDQMQAYYPHQEFGDETVRGYMFDLERLAVIHGVDVLRAALLNLRIRPGQKFFPHPSEVAEEIERAIDRQNRDRDAKQTRLRLDEQERRFWAWVDSRLQDPDTAGMTEQQFLDSVKVVGFTGRKSRTKETV
jgi:hypothetical protein